MWRNMPGMEYRRDEIFVGRNMRSMECEQVSV